MAEAPLGWVSLSELARLRNKSKGGVSKRLDRFEAQGLVTTRPGPNGTRLINIAEFDSAIGAATDAIREANGRQSAGTGPSDPVLAREQARRVSYEADLKQIELKRQLGEVLPRSDVIDAVRESALSLKRVIEQLHGRAEENAAAVARDGVPGARAWLKMIEHEWLAELARMAERFEGEEWRAEADPDGESASEGVSNDAAVPA